jgi:hypothetical protein
MRSRLEVRAGAGVSTTSNVLRLTNGLTLTDHLDLEASGQDGSTRVQIAGSLNLGGKTLKMYGGYGGALSLTSAAGARAFNVTGPGRIAFDWNQALLADGTLDSSRLVTKVSVPRLRLPEGVEWDVPSQGKVQLNAVDFVNSGTIRVESVWLAARDALPPRRGECV